jgi:uncharacterized protein (DUF433 family)
MANNFLTNNIEQSNTSEVSSASTPFCLVKFTTLSYPFEAKLFRRLMIGTNKKVCGGDPIILGTRISVPIIIEKIQNLGYALEEILSDLRNNNYNSKITAIEEINFLYPDLDQQQILACIEYYENNKREIDSIIEEEKSIDD